MEFLPLYFIRSPIIKRISLGRRQRASSKCKLVPQSFPVIERNMTSKCFCCPSFQLGNLVYFGASQIIVNEKATLHHFCQDNQDVCEGLI